MFHALHAALPLTREQVSVLAIEARKQELPWLSTRLWARIWHGFLQPDHTSMPISELKCCNSAIHRFGTTRQWKQALHLLACLPELQLERSIVSFNAAISATGKAGHWELGSTLFNQLHSLFLRPAIVTYSSGIKGLRKWTEALHLLATAKDKHLVADVVMYSLGVSACEDSGMAAWHAALQLFLDVRMLSLEEDTILAGSLISACEKGRQWQWSLHLLNNFRSARLSLSVVMFNAAISACEKCGHWQLALALLQEDASCRVRPLECF